jgi:hypothetical protein
MAEVLAGTERQQFVDVLALWYQSLFPDDPVSWWGRSEEDRMDFLPGMTAKAIKQELYKYACQPENKIKRVDEERERYKKQWDYHYDLWPTIEGKVYYFETRFDLSDPEQPIVRIMRFKPNDQRF